MYKFAYYVIPRIWKRSQLSWNPPMEPGHGIQLHVVCKENSFVD